MIREYKTIAEVAGPLMLVKNVEDELNYYELTQKGYYNVKALLKDVVIENRDHILNGIRLDIINAQYY